MTSVEQPGFIPFRKDVNWNFTKVCSVKPSAVDTLNFNSNRAHDQILAWITDKHYLCSVFGRRRQMREAIRVND
jgi:hypothetical protein